VHRPDRTVFLRWMLPLLPLLPMQPWPVLLLLLMVLPQERRGRDRRCGWMMMAYCMYCFLVSSTSLSRSSSVRFLLREDEWLKELWDVCTVTTSHVQSFNHSLSIKSIYQHPYYSAVLVRCSNIVTMVVVDTPTTSSQRSGPRSAFPVRVQQDSFWFSVSGQAKPSHTPRQHCDDDVRRLSRSHRSHFTTKSH
jgi:hypothetical protein